MKTEKFLVKEGSKLDLKKHATDFIGDYTDKKEAVKDLEKNVGRMAELQDIFVRPGYSGYGCCRQRYVIPADKKWFTRLAVSEIIVKKLESLDLHYPIVTEAHRAERLEAKELLESEA